MDDPARSRRGRPETPVSPEDGPAAVLAIELRRLREQAGSPAYRDMSHLAHVSPSALSEAARGRRWPSWLVVEGYVTACGADAGPWRTRWEELRPVADSGVPASTPQRALSGTSASGEHAGWKAARQFAWLGGAGAATALLVALMLGMNRSAGRSPESAGSAMPHASAALARGAADAGAAATGMAATGTAIPVRRHGTLTMVPGQVADLDSMAADWDSQAEPGPSTADIWFDDEDHGLHGIGDNDIAILPQGKPGGFWTCALEQDYGATIPAPDIRTGMTLCGLTAANRVAELRVTGVRRDAAGVPDEVAFDVTVWVPLHRT